MFYPNTTLYTPKQGLIFLQFSYIFMYSDILGVQCLDKDSLATIQTGEIGGKTLADLVALNIGQIGENLVLRRAVTFSTSCLDKNEKGEDIRLAIVTHPSALPSTDGSNVVYGRFGVIMAYSKDKRIGILPEGETVGKIKTRVDKFSNLLRF